LKKWDSKSPHLIAMMFADPQTKWREVSHRTFLEALEHVVKNNGIEGIKHPTANAVAGDWVTMQTVEGEHAPDPMWGPILRQLMFDTWHGRLGIKTEAPVPEIPDDFKAKLPAAVRELMLATAKKCKGRFPTTVAVLGALSEPANSAEPSPENVSATKAEAPATGPEKKITAELVSASSEAMQAAPPQASAQPEAGTTAEKQQFSVGAIVMTQACKSKEEYDGHKAEVVSVLAGGKKIRVKLLEGPKKDSRKDFNYKWLSPVENTNTSASGGAALASAAGTEEEQEKLRAERKRRAEENAARLFGSKLPKL
jgi:hypothetical protein